MDSEDRRVEAIAIRDGRIVDLGDSAEVARMAGPQTRVVDLEGRTAIPGIVESHAHPDSHAARLASWELVDPERIPSRAALLERIGELARARPGAAWIACYRFDDTKSGGYPSMEEMDRAAEGRPLFILRTDGHIGLANAAAFAAVGLGPDPSDPPFGAFDRDPATGAPTGVAREAAAHFFLSAIHAGDTPETIADGLEQVFADWNAPGITSVYNSLAGSKSIAAFQVLQARRDPSM